MKRWALLGGVIVMAAMAFAFIACSDEKDDEPTGTDTPASTAVVETPVSETPQATSAGGSTVEINLSEWLVNAQPDSVPAGSVTFNVHNIGEEEHEFVVFKTDLAPEALPTAADGSVDETGAGVELIDEVEEIPALEGEGALTADLEPGNYVLICNIADTEMGHVHYQEGMHAAFTVTQ